ncbi:MAG: hypothetical protein HQM10_18060 [Candidatus Riflebacteria bacterium]|nr:hypothetical protein [Candidatus Riflebacteria bacterium]
MRNKITFFVVLLFTTIALFAEVASVTSLTSSSSALFIESQLGAFDPEKAVAVSQMKGAPEVGPLSIAVLDGKAVILDAVLLRILFLNESNEIINIAPLAPEAEVNDICIANGMVTFLDRSNYGIYQINDGRVQQISNLTSFSQTVPVQIDSICSLGEEIAIADFSSNSIFRTSLTGKIISVATCTTFLNIAYDKDKNICGFGLKKEDEYSAFFRISPDGHKSEIQLSGVSTKGARLLGFLENGDAAGLSVFSYEPFVKQLFKVDQSGKCTEIDRISLPSRFASKLGIVDGSDIWLSYSPIGTQNHNIRKYRIK